MYRTVRRSLTVAALAGAALLAVPAAAAQAAQCGSITQSTGDNVGLLNGTQLAVPVNLDLNVTHNALGILGLGYASGDDSRTTTCNVRHRVHVRHHH